MGGNKFIYFCRVLHQLTSPLCLQHKFTVNFQAISTLYKPPTIRLRDCYCSQLHFARPFWPVFVDYTYSLKLDAEDQRQPQRHQKYDFNIISFCRYDRGLLFFLCSKVCTWIYFPCVMFLYSYGVIKIPVSAIESQDNSITIFVYGPKLKRKWIIFFTLRPYLHCHSIREVQIILILRILIPKQYLHSGDCPASPKGEVPTGLG